MGNQDAHGPGILSTSERRLPDRSVAEFIADHYGQETVDYLVEPLLYAVYGGDPRQMSATAIIPQMTQIEAKYGSLTRGVLSGMRKRRHNRRRRAVRAESSSSPCAAACPAWSTPSFRIGRGDPGLEPLRPKPLSDRRWIRVRVNGDWLEAKNIVIATPAWGAADLIQDLAPQAAELLREIPYRSSLTVSLAYKERMRRTLVLPVLVFWCPRLNAKQ